MKKNDLTKLPIIKALLIIAIPTIFANVVQSMYQLIDLFWVSKLGEDAVASISVSFPILVFFMSVGIGFSTAGSILISQYKGAQNQEKLNEVATQSILIALVFALIISIIGYILTPTAIGYMSLDENVSINAIKYLQMSFIGNIFVFGYMSLRGALRGVGEVKLPLYIVMFTVFLNLIIDPILINGYGFIKAYGVEGAAKATAITQFTAFTIATKILISGKQLVHIDLKKMKPNFALMKKIFKIGFPTSIEMSLRTSSMVVLTFLVASFGTTVVAAYGIMMQIYVLVILPSVGLAVATSTLVGQNLGAGHIDRAKETTIKASLIGFSVLTTLAILVFVFASQIVGLFLDSANTNIYTILTSITFIKILAFSFSFVILSQIINATFQGAGQTKVSLYISLISIWLVQIPFAYFVSKSIFLELAFPSSVIFANLIALIIGVIWYKKGNWEHKKIIHH